MFLAPDDAGHSSRGTYFPNERALRHAGVQRRARSAWPSIYRTQRDDMREHGDEARATCSPRCDAGAADERDALTRDAARSARATLAASFDARVRRLRRARRSSRTPTTLELLLRAAGARRDERRAATAGALHGDAHAHGMAEGGLYDQLGGGFRRYSVDAVLDDPALREDAVRQRAAARALREARARPAMPLFRRIARETADWMLRDMQAPNGGFYSTLDADSEGHEGKFYVWTRDEVESLLAGGEVGVAFARRFGLDRDAEFRGHDWHLHVSGRPRDSRRSSA